MAIDGDITEDLRPDLHADVADDGLRVRKRRVKVRRKKDKFPRPLRVALMLGAPIALWTGIYFVADALL
jgi:hypothetical protein